MHNYWIPVADIGFDVEVVKVGEPVSFNALGSSDTDSSREFVDNGYVPRYYWEFGDGATAESYWYDLDNDGARNDPEFATDGVYDGMTTHAYAAPGVYYPVLYVNDEDKKVSSDSAIVIVIPYELPVYPETPETPPTQDTPIGDAARTIVAIVRFELTKSTELIPEESLSALIEMTDEVYSLIQEGSYQQARELILQAMDLMNSTMEEGDMKNALLESYDQAAKYLDISEGVGTLTAYSVVEVVSEDGLTTITVTMKFYYHYEGEEIIIETTITFTNILKIYRAHQ